MFFDINKYSYCFQTNPNEAYFWHGQSTDENGNIYGGQDNAMRIAEENGGKTLEMCMLDHRDDLEKAGVHFNDYDDGTVKISYGSNSDENNRFWSDCSESFADQASGDIHVIEGQDPREDGTPEMYSHCVYNDTEHKNLLHNSNITSITHIDAINGNELGLEQVNNDENKTLPEAQQPLALPPGSNDLDDDYYYGMGM